MAYAILRFSKQRGGSARALEAHHERKKEAYKSNPDIDPNRSAENVHLIRASTSYNREIGSRIQSAGCKVRKDSVKFIDTLITASPEFFSFKPPEKKREFFVHALEFVKARVGAGNIFVAVVHMDEKTPHMHLCFTPITPDNRLSAKEIMGNRPKMVEWQDAFHAHMSERWPELERGQPAAETKREHIPVRLFKQAVKLDNHMEIIERLLGDINVFNATRKRQEALDELAKLLPAAEGFSAQVKQAQSSIDYVVSRNKTLQDRLDDKDEQLRKKEEAVMNKNIEAQRLQESVRRYERLLSRIPPEILEQVKTSQKTHQAR